MGNFLYQPPHSNGILISIHGLKIFPSMDRFCNLNQFVFCIYVSAVR